MVSVTIHQDTSAIPPMTSPVIDLVSRPDSPNVHQPLPTTITATATTTTTIMTTIPLPHLVDANQALEERFDKHGSRLYRLENQDIPNQVSKVVDEIVTDVVDWAMHAPLKERFRDLPEADMKEILHNNNEGPAPFMTLLKQGKRRKKKTSASPKSSPLLSNLNLHLYSRSPLELTGCLEAHLGRLTHHLLLYSILTVQTMTDTRLKPFVSSIPKELHMDDDTTADEQAYSSSGLPLVNLKDEATYYPDGRLRANGPTLDTDGGWNEECSMTSRAMSLKPTLPPRRQKDSSLLLVLCINLSTRNMLSDNGREDFSWGLERWVQIWGFNDHGGSMKSTKFRDGTLTPDSRSVGLHRVNPHIEGERMVMMAIVELPKTDKDGKVRYSILRSRQSQRDLPRDNPLVSVEVLRIGFLKGVMVEEVKKKMAKIKGEKKAALLKP
ncbi:hypothetical protein Tco_0531687 [Tanacetum coccineum]